MMKVRHIQSQQEREVGRYTWENPESEYQKMRRLWEVLDKGDPVRVIWIEENGEEKDLGLYDRDHAINMIKMDSRRCYYTEIEDESSLTNVVDPETILIEQILKDAQNNYISPSRDTPDDYEQALYKAKRMGLVKNVSKDSYDLTSEGQEAFDLGGLANWKKAKKENHEPPRTIHVTGGNAVIGDNNTGNVQGRDFLNSESPTIKNNPQHIQPKANPISKSGHSTWDKIKYISVIIGGISALIAGLSKLAEWW